MAVANSLFLYSVPAPRNWDEAQATGTSIARARICEAMARAVAERGYATVTVKDSSSITGNTAPVGWGPDVYNYGVLHVDAGSIVGIVDLNPAQPI